MIESPMLQHVGGYINGRWVLPAAGQSLAVKNPATGDHLADVPNMGAAEAAAAIEAADAAFANDTATTEIYTLSLHDAFDLGGRRIILRNRQRHLVLDEELPHPPRGTAPRGPAAPVRVLRPDPHPPPGRPGLVARPRDRGARP